MNSHWGKRKGERGQAVMVAVLFFLVGGTLTMGAIAGPVLREVKSISEWKGSRQSFFTSEASVEDVVYRISNNVTVSNSEALSLGNSYATTTVADVAGGKKLTAIGDNSNLIRKNEVILDLGAGASFHYGLQTDAGGLVLANSSSVNGNVFSNGPVVGTNNTITGEAISAGPSGSINGIRTNGSAYANSIVNSTIGRDAYYQSISGSTVSGASYPGSPDQATTSLPITDEQIAQWETDAAMGGTITSPCPYTVTSSQSLGPVKINCNLAISGTATLTLTGAVWVSGNMTMSNSSKIQISPSLGNASVPIVVHNPADESNGSTITITNSAQFIGSGSPSSYVVLISQNKSAEQGGGVTAVNMTNSVQGDVIVYALHGLVRFSNSVNINGAAAYKAQASNSAQINYETGLVNLLFSSGPGGGYTLGSWKEIY